MSVEEFLTWAEGRAGRWELEDGHVVAMAPERATHALTKYAAQSALARAIRKSSASCQMFPDGMTVRIASDMAFEPDALVHCGARIARDALEIPSPVIVVEVLSDSTARRDHGIKLKGYFSLPSLQHYILVDADRRMVIHHKRGTGTKIETFVFSSGVIECDPPGLSLPFDEIFADFADT